MGSSRTNRALLAVAVVGALGGGAAAPASAQSSAQDSAQAESEFRLGKDRMKAGRIAEACGHFEASQRLESNVVTLMSLADCREKNQELASAWGAWVTVESKTRRDRAAAAYHDIAVKRAAELEPRLSYLTINVPDESRVHGLEIRRNGQLVDRAVWNRSVPVDGGAHRIDGKAPGHEGWSTQVTIGPERDRRSVEVPKFKELDKLVDGTGTTIHQTVIVEEPSILTGRRKLALGVAGAGLASVAAGAVLGYQAQGLRDRAERRCPVIGCSPADAEAANSLNDRAQTRALTANIAFGVGAAAVATGAVLWFLGAPAVAEEFPDDDSLSLTPLLSPGGFGLVATGRF
jgi:hypothetical protein